MVSLLAILVLLLLLLRCVFIICCSSITSIIIIIITIIISSSGIVDIRTISLFTTFEHWVLRVEPRGEHDVLYFNTL